MAARPVRVEEARAQLQTRISELERLTGKQAAELDFFAAALRSVQETAGRAAHVPARHLPSDLNQVAAQGQASIERMCELGQVSRAGFYRDWQERQPVEAEVALRDAIQKAALARRSYGYRRITPFVQRACIAVGEGVVRRLLRSDNL